MNMKKILLIITALLLSASHTFAQKDAKAREVLDNTSQSLLRAGGIRATFGGSTEGTLLLKGECFYLNAGGVQSWFDGKTQWSYVEANEEVNISSPTPEELQGIHPYAFLSLYKNGYNYKYIGAKTRNGKSGYEVVLTPERKQDITAITLFVSREYQPIYIKVEQQQMPANEIFITSCQTNQPLDVAAFRFEPKKFPDAEVIDLR